VPRIFEKEETETETETETENKNKNSLAMVDQIAIEIDEQGVPSTQTQTQTQSNHSTNKTNNGNASLNMYSLLTPEDAAEAKKEADAKANEDPVHAILRRMRRNCVYLSIYHNRKHHFYKNILFCVFRAPQIFLNALNAFFAVGLQHYLDQKTISLLNALVSLFCGVLTSIELMWQLKDRVDQELESHKNFYKLSTDIFRYLESKDENKKDKNEFLTEMFNLYQKNIATANVINVYRRGFLDELEFISRKDKEDVSEFIQKKHEKDLRVHYFSECCL